MILRSEPRTGPSDEHATSPSNTTFKHDHGDGSAGAAARRLVSNSVIAPWRLRGGHAIGKEEAHKNYSSPCTRKRYRHV